MNSNKRPYLILQPSVNTTTVVTTTTTTTNYAPIPLPQLPQQSSSVSSTNFDKNIYPLQNTRIPQSLRSFPIVFPGGARATFRDDEHNLPDDPPDNPSGVGWRMVPRESDSDHNNIHISLPDALDRFAKKRSLNSDILMEGVEPNRKRQRPAAPPSPLPSPRGSPSPTTDEFPLQPDLSLTTLLTLPSLLSHFITLPPQLQSHFLLTLLRHSPLPVLRTLHSVLTPTLARDFLTLLPPELVSHVLSFLPFSTLARASRVSKSWRAIIDSDPVLWRDLLKSTKIWFGGDSERAFARSIYAQRARIQPHQLPTLPLPHPYKTLFKSRHLTRTRWVHNQNPKHTSFPAHGSSVVTCLLFSHGRIISASDDYSIHAYSPLTGQLLRSFDGHEGGVWALAASHDTLVSGSTDRTVRIWNLSTGRCTHVFGGHTSTVRCLAIVKPEVVDVERDAGVFVREKWPKRPLIVTGSRDHSLRVWTLPRRGDPEYRSFSSAGDEGEGGVGEDVDDNPYHKLHLEGHDQAVRALAARGRILVSGSYDCTVRIWDIITGECKWILTGHSQKVYSVVLDLGRNQACSGSMDGTVRVWDLRTGECQHTLTGHTSLVGLLGLSPSYLVSAAADSTLRIWDSNTGSLLHTLAAHTGAITCFQHDEFKVLSGSDGTLKMWNVRDGGVVRDLLTGITGVWQVVFEGRWCAAASNRNDETVLDVWDFGREGDDDEWVGEPPGGMYDEESDEEGEGEDEEGVDGGGGDGVEGIEGGEGGDIGGEGEGEGGMDEEGGEGVDEDEEQEQADIDAMDQDLLPSEPSETESSADVDSDVDVDIGDVDVDVDAEVDVDTGGDAMVGVRASRWAPASMRSRTVASGSGGGGGSGGSARRGINPPPPPTDARRTFQHPRVLPSNDESPIRPRVRGHPTARRR